MDIGTNGPGMFEKCNTSVGECQKRPSGLPPLGLGVESRTFKIKIGTSDHYLVWTFSNVHQEHVWCCRVTTVRITVDSNF